MLKKLVFGKLLKEFLHRRQEKIRARRAKRIKKLIGKCLLLVLTLGVGSLLWAHRRLVAAKLFNLRLPEGEKSPAAKFCPWAK